MRQIQNYLPQAQLSRLKAGAIVLLKPLTQRGITQFCPQPTDCFPASCLEQTTNDKIGLLTECQCRKIAIPEKYL